MPPERWEVTATISGQFYLRNERMPIGPCPPMAGLRSLTFVPELDEKSNKTGRCTLKAAVPIDNDTDDDLPYDQVMDRARLLVQSVASLASVAIGSPVTVVGSPRAQRRLTEMPPTYGKIVTSGMCKTLMQPIPLPLRIFAAEVKPNIQRVIRWLARGIVADDPVDKLMSLNNALDLIAGMTEGAPNRTRRCRACDEEESIGPGLRERIVYFLTDTAGLDTDRAEAIYEIRNDLTHARTNLTPRELRDFEAHAATITLAVRNAVAGHLKISLPPLPLGPIIPSFGALLVITLADNPVSDESSHPQRQND